MFIRFGYATGVEGYTLFKEFKWLTVNKYYWLLSTFILREIRNRYVSSTGGLLWAFLNPIMHLLIYAFVFSYIFKVRLPGMESTHFLGFVAIALWPWLAFQEAVQLGMVAIRGNAELIKKAALPYEILIYSRVAATFFVHTIGYALVLIIINLFVVPLHLWLFPVLLLWLILLLLLTTGLVLLLSPLHILFPDIEHILPPVLMALFYATPVLYSAEMVPSKFGFMLSVNPLALYFETIRGVMLNGLVGINGPTLMMAVGFMAIFVIGRWFFSRLSPYFEDFL